MDYKERNINAIAAYIKSGEKSRSMHKIGIEAEHFVVNALDGAPSSHAADIGGSRAIKALSEVYPGKVYIEGRLSGLKGGPASISLEPGGQLEVSLDPLETIGEIYSEYQKFYSACDQLFEPLGIKLACEGTLPQGSINDLPLLPKKRYQFMYDYFGKSGLYGRNMMKGTSSLQASIDYSDEDDFKMKFRLANILSLVFYNICSNSKAFEGLKADSYMRLRIWQNTDPDRCGIAGGALGKRYSYESYAREVYSKPALVALSDGEPFYAANRPLSEIYKNRPMSAEEIAYALSMFFYDARVVRFIEIRPADCLPFDAAMGYFALIKGIFYTDCLGALSSRFDGVGFDDYQESLRSLLEDGDRAALYGQNAIDLSLGIIDMAYNALSDGEKDYILPLKGFYMENMDAVAPFLNCAVQRRKV